MHQKSVTGITAQMAGGTILYKTRFLDVIALSLTEAEFIAASDADKNNLYIRSILNDSSLEQEQATIIYEDNQRAIAIANLGKPTKLTKHIETRHFALQYWIEMDLLQLKRSPTDDNSATALTKNTHQILFNRHSDFLVKNDSEVFSYLSC